MTEKKVSSKATARAIRALAEIDPEAGAGIAKLITLVSVKDTFAIKLLGRFERQEITVQEALGLVDQYLKAAN